jgi:hypothetical protein
MPVPPDGSVQRRASRQGAMLAIDCRGEQHLLDELRRAEELLDVPGLRHLGAVFRRCARLHPVRAEARTDVEPATPMQPGLRIPSVRDDGNGIGLDVGKAIQRGEVLAPIISSSPVSAGCRTTSTVAPRAALAGARARGRLGGMGVCGSGGSGMVQACDSSHLRAWFRSTECGSGQGFR